MARILMVLFLLSAAGCATWPGGEAARRGKAIIYIYRESGGVNSPYPKAVLLDGRPVGTLSGNGYLVVAAEPGEHIVSTSAADTNELMLIVEEGREYYLSQEIIPTQPHFHVLLNRIGEAMGRQRVARAHRQH